MIFGFGHQLESDMKINVLLFVICSITQYLDKNDDFGFGSDSLINVLLAFSGILVISFFGRMFTFHYHFVREIRVALLDMVGIEGYYCSSMYILHIK